MYKYIPVSWKCTWKRKFETESGDWMTGLGYELGMVRQWKGKQLRGRGGTFRAEARETKGELSSMHEVRKYRKAFGKKQLHNTKWVLCMYEVLTHVENVSLYE